MKRLKFSLWRNDRTGRSLLFSVLLITSCEKDQLSAPGVVPGEAEIEQGIFDPLLNEGMIQLGKQLENPYSVENMRLALRELQEEGVFFLEGLQNNCVLAFSSKRNIFDTII